MFRGTLFSLGFGVSLLLGISSGLLALFNMRGLWWVWIGVAAVALRATWWFWQRRESIAHRYPSAEIIHQWRFHKAQPRLFDRD